MDSEEKYRIVFENSMDAVLLTSTDGKIIAANNAACSMLGRTEEEICRLGRKGVVDPADPRLQHALEERKKNGEFFGELTMVKKDGTRFPAEISTVVFTGENGKNLTSMVIRDISQRKSIEEELRKALEWQTMIFEGSRDAIFISDANSRFVAVNSSACKLTGYSKEELLSMRIPDLHDQPDQEAYKKFHNRIFNGEEILSESKILRKDGIKIDTEFNNRCVSLSGELFMHTTARDISERKRAEREIIENEKFLKEIQALAHLGSYVLDIRSGTWQSSKILDDIFGIDENYGRTVEGWSLLVHPERRGEMVDYFTKYVLGKRRRFDKEYKIIRNSDETERWVHGRGELEFDMHDKPVRMIGTIMDITDRKQAEIDLKESEERFRRIFESSSIGMVLTRPDKRIFKANPAFCSMLGYTEEEICCKTFLDLTHPDHFNTDKKKVEDLWKGKITNYRTEKRYIAKSGEIRWGSLSSSLIMGQGDKPRYALALIEDITESKITVNALHESEAILARTQALAHLGSWKLDIKHNKLLWSEETYRIFGMPKGTKLNQEVFLSCVHPDDRDWVDQAGKEAISGVPYDIEHRIKRDGEVIWVREHAQLEYDSEGNPGFIIGMVQDITRQKQAEEKIRLLNIELEERIAHRTDQLIAANNELEAFAYSVSHDLRAPLRSINGFASILKSDYHEKIDEEGKRVIDTIIKNAIRMGDLIDDLLEFSRLGRNKISTSSIDTNNMVDEIVKELTLQEKGRKIEVNIRRLCNCVADHAMMRQVWINLVANAIKYTRKKEVSLIEIGCYHENTNKCYYIKDNGTGFDMKYADKLFKVFQRLHSLEEFEGTGVGLALVKRIVTRHGGKVWAEGKVNEGAIFYFTLPE